MTSAASTIAPTRSGHLQPRSLAFVRGFGALVFAYGILLTATTSFEWASLQPPGTTLGPPSYIQGLTIRITEGLSLAAFGVVLAGSGFWLSRIAGRRAAEGRSQTSGRLPSVLPYAAALLVLSAAVVGALPAPERTLTFAPADFQFRPLPGNQPFENYFVSRPFVAREAEAFFPGLSVTWTDNQTGAVVERGTLVATWVTVPTALPDPLQHFGTGNLAPVDGSYVAWVQYSMCETPATRPCSNYTASVAGILVIRTQQAYEPVQLVLGAAGSVLMAVTLIHSDRGNRRTTSR